MSKTKVFSFRAFAVAEDSPAYLNLPNKKMSGQVFNNADVVQRLMEPIFDGAVKEQFWGLYLDTKHRLVGMSMISEGTLSSAVVEPREAFIPAFQIPGVRTVIFVHNHPSGDTTPSKSDDKVTEMLVDSGKILNINVLDHVIVGDPSVPYATRAYSYHDTGRLHSFPAKKSVASVVSLNER